MEELPQEFEFPACWHDDALMIKYFDEFPVKSENPSLWNDQMSFWVTLITRYCHERRMVLFNHEDLRTIFKRNGSHPRCLRTVINHMTRQQDLQSIEDFVEAPPDMVSWVNHLRNIIRSPVLWGIQVLRRAGYGERHFNEPHIMTSALELSARELLMKFRNAESLPCSRSVIWLRDLQKVCQHHMETFQPLLLMNLFKENNACIKDLDGEWAVKFRCSAEGNLTPFTKTEEAMLKLYRAQKLVQETINETEANIVKNSNEANKYLLQGFQYEAQIHLNSKKRLEEALPRKQRILDSVKGLLEKLKGPVSEATRLDALRFGVQGLREVCEGRVNVEATLAEVEKTLSMVSGRREAISRLVDASTDTDDLQRLVSSAGASRTTSPQVYHQEIGNTERMP